MSDAEQSAETIPQFRVQFGSSQLHAIKNLMKIDPGGVAFEIDKHEFTVAAVGPANIVAASVTFDSGVFLQYDLEQAGQESVSGNAFDGILNAIYQIEDRNSRTFELALQGDTVSLEDNKGQIGGRVPYGSYVDRPSVSSFEDELTATATVAAPAAVRPLYRRAECVPGDGMAELVASYDTATLTMSGREAKRADLGNADHEDGVIGVWSAEKIRDAFVSFERVNNETTVRWGDDLPVVLEMDAGSASYQAVVAPRIPEEDHEPLYKTASDVDSVDVVTAGGFK